MSFRQRTSIEAMAEATCIVGALLPLEGNDKPLVVNVSVTNLYCYERKKKTMSYRHFDI